MDVMDDETALMFLEGMTQEDIDDVVRTVTDMSLFVVGEVYGTRVRAGPPSYPYYHDRVYGVVIEDVDDEFVRYRYVIDRTITQGTLKGLRPDVVIDAVMEADGPCLADWTVKDQPRTSRLHRQGPDEYFVDEGEDECVTFCA